MKLSATGTGDARRWRTGLALAAILCTVQAFLLVGTALDKSETVDEPVYLGLSWRQWHGEYSRAPALPLWGYGLAQRFVDPTFTTPPATTLENRGHFSRLRSLSDAQYRLDLRAARMATIVVVVLAGLLLRSVAGRFGPRSAALTHVLWCFSPLMLAHGSLATVDAWVACGLVLVLWCSVRWLEKPTLMRAGMAAAALAVAACAKVTALVAVPAMLAVAAFKLNQDPHERTRRAVSLLACAAAAFVVTLWGLYGFHFPASADSALIAGEAANAASPQTASLLRSGPRWIESLVLQLNHGYRAGHQSYLFGHVSSYGWWWFYLASLALQTTIAAQCLALFRVAAAVAAPPPRRELLVDAALLATPLLLLLVMSVARAQNGIRYLLPAWPFLALLGGRAMVDVDRLFDGRAHRLASLAVAAVVTFGAWSALAVHPHYLMYFNEWIGGPDNGPRYLVSGSDWGQDERRLGEWQKQNHVSRLFFVRYSSYPKRWGIRSRRPPCTPTVGVYALHAVHVVRPSIKNRGCWEWLTSEVPDEKIGYSIYLYRVDEARLARLKAKAPRPARVRGEAR